jgi:hypothetical protein
VAGVVALSHASGASSPSTPAAAAAKAGFTLSVSDPNINVPAGSQGAEQLTITRTGGFTGAVTLSVAGLPSYVAGSLTPNPVTGGSSTLTLQPAQSAVQGSLNLTVTGTASGAASVSASIHLTVSAGQNKQFTISGSLDRQLYPGGTGSLNLALTNPNNQPMSISTLAVSVAQVSKAGCSPAVDFGVTQFSGSYPLTVPANSTRTLSQLSVPPANWPKVTMIDRPVNQDACKNATLTLSFTGSGAGN